MPSYVCQRCYWAGYDPAEFSRLNLDDVICTDCWLKKPAVKHSSDDARREVVVPILSHDDLLWIARDQQANR